jgi:hypothetical protein
MTAAYAHESPGILELENEHDKGRQNGGGTQGDGAELPGELLLTSTWEQPLHDAEDVEGGEQVEGLEDDVPC